MICKLRNNTYANIQILREFSIFNVQIILNDFPAKKEFCLAKLYAITTWIHLHKIIYSHNFYPAI